MTQPRVVYTRHDNRSTKQVSESSSQLQTKKDSVKTQLVPIKFSIKRSSACLDHGSLTLVKTEDPPHPIIEFKWRGHAVGREAKELFEAIEQCYPNTFQRVHIRDTMFWMNNLKALHVAITSFMGSYVDALVEEEIMRFHQDFKDLESLGFDLSWAHQRLDMVARLKFGKEPLHEEMMALEQSIGPLKERLGEIMNQLIKTHEMYTKALSEYEDATKALSQKVEEMTQKYGASYGQVLKDRLGFGMLPGY